MKQIILIFSAVVLAFALIALKITMDDKTSFIANFTMYFTNGN